MRRPEPLALALLLGLLMTVDLRAQVVRPPSGGVSTQAQGGGGGGSYTPWTEWSDPAGPYPTTTEQYPLIRFYWCDDLELDPSSRWIKVNGVNRTSSFTYAEQDPSGSCDSRARSQTTTVPLNIGDNLVEMYICDMDEEMGPFCYYGMQYISRLAVGAPAVTLRNFNAENQDRSLCLTVGAGQAAGLACGDLFVTHGLPAYRTMGRDRSLTLFYSSHQAAPRPTVAAWVSQPSGLGTPNSVYAELKVNGTVRASATYWAWSSSSGPRQIALAYDASGDTSRLVPFSLEVRNQYTGGNYSTTIYDTLIVVNRLGSEFGGGWWLAGVEQLVLSQPGNKILWLGGDGSAAVYRSAGTNVWVRASGAFRDTLVLASNVYTRTLRHGVQVKFDNAGRHIQTVNRTGQTTTFTWSGSLLTSIQVPPGVSGTTYTLVYDGSSKLDYIADPAGRVLNGTVSSGNLTQLTDPDNVGVSFGYDGSRRMTSRTGRRSYATAYVYGNGLHVTRVAVPLRPSTCDSSITTLEWWDEKGLAIGSPGGSQSAADTASVFTRVFGPRPNVNDNATFWVDRWGAPVRIIGARNDTTILTRDVATGLVTMVRNPVHDSVTATYTPRGNLQAVTDHTVEGSGVVAAATTSYVYGNDSVPDSPTEARSPVDTTRFHYNAGLGLPDTIVSQGGARVALNYIQSGNYRGLVQSVAELAVRVVDTLAWTRSLGTLVTQLRYDVLGNDTALVSPSGAYTRSLRNNVGLVYRRDDPAGHRTDYAYNALNQTTVVQVFDGQASFSTLFDYDSAGQLWRIRDPRNVTQQWSYDAGGRPVSMTDEAGATETRFYGASGLLDSVATRTGHTVRHRYDAGGQLLVTSYPARAEQFSSWWEGAFDRMMIGDSIVRTYDVGGRLLSTARARDTVAFEWNREGTLRSERQVVRNSAGTPMSAFTVRYWTDLGGRRTKMFNGTDTLRYGYGTDGRLATLAVQWKQVGMAADTFRFWWDALGRRDSVVYVGPNSHVSYGYDVDGRLRMVCSRHPGNPYGTDYLENVRVVTSVTPDGFPRSWMQRAGGSVGSGTACSPLNLPNELELENDAQYDGRHQLVHGGITVFAYDGSGNRVSRRSSSYLLDSLTHAPGGNRLATMLGESGNPPQVVTVKYYGYNPDGSLHYEGVIFGNELPGSRFFYYNALGETVGHYASVLSGDVLVWVGDSVLFHYDPLGRRVSAPESGAWLGFDGENVVRNYGPYQEPLWRYVHGPATDDPLVGVYQAAPGQYYKHYYLTDGGGRLLAFTAADGTDRLSDVTYTRWGGAAAGAITRSSGFDNQRMEASGAPQLSFYRNRYYDQKTGRWTQEDPIGPAGGVNLYAYVGNNPVAYTDPFGLKFAFDSDSGGVMRASWEHALRVLRRAAEGGDQDARLALNRFKRMEQSTIVYTFVNRTRGGGLGDSNGRVMTIDVAAHQVARTVDRLQVNVASTMVHEAGHTWYANSTAGVLNYDSPTSGAWALASENAYRLGLVPQWQPRQDHSTYPRLGP